MPGAAAKRPTERQRRSTVSRKLTSLEQNQTFCPRLRRVDQARACAPRAVGDAGFGGGGWIVSGHAAGCNFRGLRLHRPLALPAVCASGSGRVGARKHRSLRRSDTRAARCCCASGLSPERFEKIHASFDHHEFWALMFPAMLPPPTPFKIVVLAAAAFEMNFGHFLLAIFAGRFVRFLIEALLTLWFGPQIVTHDREPLRASLRMDSGGSGMLVAGWLIWRRRSNAKPNMQSVGVDGSTLRPLSIRSSIV